jgi:hypothetical protein
MIWIPEIGARVGCVQVIKWESSMGLVVELGFGVLFDYRRKRQSHPALPSTMFIALTREINGFLVLELYAQLMQYGVISSRLIQIYVS